MTERGHRLGGRIVSSRLIACGLAFGVLLCTGPATVATSAEASPAGSGIVDTGRFRISIPPGDEWQVTTQPDRVFLRTDDHADGRLVGTTAVLVLRTRPVEEKCGLPAEETAANYCRDEEFDLWVSGQVTGLFGLEDVTRDKVVIDSKTLYAMHYHQAFAEEFGGARTDNMMYMYFPESFGADNYFYVFLQTEACMRDACPGTDADMDETPVRSIIRSLDTRSASVSD